MQQIPQRLEKIPKDQPAVVYCHMGAPPRLRLALHLSLAKRTAAGYA
jgi:hypothetical protein